MSRRPSRMGRFVAATSARGRDILARFLRLPSGAEAAGWASVAVWVVVVAAAVVFSGRRVVESPEFAAVQEVVIVGAQRTEERRVLATAGLDRPRNIWTLDEQWMAAALRELPYVYRATVSVDALARTVYVDLVESPPAAVAVDEGALVLVNADGERMGPWGALEEPVPWLFGFVSEEGRRDERMVRTGLQLLEVAQTLGFTGVRGVREVHRLPVGTLRVVLADGVEVRLAEDRLVERLLRLRDTYGVAERDERRLRHVVLDGPDLDHVTVAWVDPLETP
jgi:cell division septal protein FtsQ